MSPVRDLSVSIEVLKNMSDKNKSSNGLKLDPISDNIIVSPEKAETKTVSGIIIPESVEKEKPQTGKVISVGPGRLSMHGERIKMQIKKGDIVLFSKYSPQEIKLEGKEYFILKEDDVLAIIN